MELGGVGNFSETDQFRWLATSSRYFSAARVLVGSHQFTRNRALFLPILQLTAHGTELLLKGNLIGAGLSPDEVRKNFGHDLMLLWRAADNLRLRSAVMLAAREARSDAESDNRWRGGNGCTDELLTEQMERLSLLHGKATDFALRYPADEGLEGPHPAFLLETFEKVVRFGLGQPERLRPGR